MAFKILSIDGGGIRGILPGQIIVTLEKKLQEKTGNKEARVSDFFDMVAGTSTGGILAAGYVCPNEKNRPKYTASEVVDFYLEDGDEIFDVGLWRKIQTLSGLCDEKYSQKELERVLQRAFGDITLDKLLKATCIVSYDVKSRKPVIFAKHTAVSKNQNFYVKDLLRATSAAPTYFEPAKIYSVGENSKKYILIDGGILANDPTLCAYSEALKFEEVNGIKDMMIVSLGTGKDLKEYEYDDVKDVGLVGWAKPVVDIALEGGPQMTEYHMKKIASTVPNSKFFRIQPELYGASKEMDDASIENLKKLKDAGDKNAIAYDSLLNEIVEELIKV